MTFFILILTRNALLLARYSVNLAIPLFTEWVITANTFLDTPVYLTTPIFYPSGLPHIGHAYTLYAADSLARLHRQGSDLSTFFSTGTDEHGEKLQRVAEQHNKTPQSWVEDIVAREWRPLIDKLGVTNDVFIRTTDEAHVSAVQNFIQALHERDYIYEGVHAGLYCVECEEKKTSSELIKGDGQYSGLNVCAIHKKPVEELAETNYFFRLSAFTQPLLELIEQKPNFIQPVAARNEVLSLLRSGLEDLSISRTSFTWGIPVPWDTSHVIYVWFDALLNYVSALGYDGVTADLPALYEDAVHIIGRDILRFHAIVLPALLLAHDLVLPRQIITHGWILNKGEKVAKSSGNAISPVELVEKYGTDAVRYHLLRSIPLGKDGGFSEEELAGTYNTFLANSYGNLASRLHALIRKNANGVIPARGITYPADQQLTDLVNSSLVKIQSASTIDSIQVLIAEVEQLIQATNLYLSEQEPWHLKDDTQLVRVQEILGTASYAFLTAARLATALLPVTTVKVEASFNLSLSDSLRPAEAAGTHISTISPLFPRI